MSDSILGVLKKKRQERIQLENQLLIESQKPKKGAKKVSYQKEKTNMQIFYESLKVKMESKSQNRTNKLQEEVNKWIQNSKCKKFKITKIKKKQYDEFKELRAFIEADKLRLTDLQVVTLGCIIRHFSQDIEPHIRPIRIEAQEVGEDERQNELGLDVKRSKIRKREGFNGENIYALPLIERKRSGRRVGRRDFGEPGVARPAEQRSQLPGL